MNHIADPRAVAWFGVYGEKRAKLVAIPKYVIDTYGVEFSLVRAWIIKDLNDKVLQTLNVVDGSDSTPMAIFMKESMLTKAQELGVMYLSRIVQTSVYMGWVIPTGYTVVDVDDYSHKGMAYPAVGAILTKELLGGSKDLVVCDTLPKPSRFGCFKYNTRILLCREVCHAVFS